MKSLFRETILLFTKNFTPLLTMALPFLFMMALADQILLLPDVRNGIFVNIIIIIANGVLFCILSTTIIVFLSKTKYGDFITPKESILAGIVFAPYALVCYVILSLPVIAFWTLATNGGRFFTVDVSFIFPLSLAYIYVIFKCSFAMIFIVIDHDKPLNAIKKSFYYTSGYLLKIFLVTLVFALPMSVGQTFFYAATNQLQQANMLFYIFGDILFGIFSILIHISVFLIFCMSYAKYKGTNT